MAAEGQRLPGVIPAQVSILVADDDGDLRRMIGTALLFEGYKVEVAANGAEALTHVRRHVPDVILLDLVMPWVNGLEVLATLRSDPKTADIPVVVMTGTPARPRELQGLGPVDIVHKPFNQDLLLAVVMSVLSRPAGTRDVRLADSL